MNYTIDKKLYNELLNGLNNQFHTEKIGVDKDMDFMTNDRWLRDTVVIENIEERKGLWKIFLVFAHYKNPLLLIRREVSVCFMQKKALLYAQYMRRIAAKDSRGTLEVDINDFVTHAN